MAKSHRKYREFYSVKQYNPSVDIHLQLSQNFHTQYPLTQKAYIIRTPAQWRIIFRVPREECNSSTEPKLSLICCTDNNTTHANQRWKPSKHPVSSSTQAHRYSTRLHDFRSRHRRSHNWSWLPDAYCLQDNCPEDAPKILSQFENLLPAASPPPSLPLSPTLRANNLDQDFRRPCFWFLDAYITLTGFRLNDPCTIDQPRTRPPANVLINFGVVMRLLGLVKNKWLVPFNVERGLRLERR